MSILWDGPRGGGAIGSEREEYSGSARSLKGSRTVRQPFGPSLRLLMNLEQLEPAFEDRPAARFATGLLPEYEGHVPPVFPADWLE